MNDIKKIQKSSYGAWVTTIRKFVGLIGRTYINLGGLRVREI